MAISAKNAKILWAEAAGRCAFQDCGEKLCIDQAGKFAPYTIGEMAHIKGKRAGSNRHDPDQDLDEREAYTNEAKRLCRDQKVGLYKIGDFMAALNRKKFWTYLDEYETKYFKKQGWL